MESKMKQAGTATLTVDGKTVELPILSGTDGANCIDVRKLHALTGHFTIDPGFTSTASTESQLTFINGGKGQLVHGGYSIEALADKADFTEVIYLLLNGELPSQAQFDGLTKALAEKAVLPQQTKEFYKGFSKDAHPMAMMTATMGALSALYEEVDIEDEAYRMDMALNMIAQIPVLAARAYKHSIGEDFVDPDPSLSYAANFLKMTFGKAGEDYKVDPVIADAMDKIFILHADHEQNASTSTVRLAGSSGTNPYAAITAGVACLWGPSHGGANEACLNMLNEIGSVDRIPEFVARAKDKADPFRLMGFGHRVYKNHDPRARVMEKTTHEILGQLNIDNPILDVAMELEKIALSDEYFVERNLYPNVDFYSGIVLSALGFPTSMFTVLFALARTTGWAAQWHEFHGDPSQRIGRPRQLFTGPAPRDYTEIAKR